MVVVVLVVGVESVVVVENVVETEDAVGVGIVDLVEFSISSFCKVSFIHIKI